jgi:hypothetical protein
LVAVKPHTIGMVLQPYFASPTLSSTSLITSLMSEIIKAKEAYKTVSLKKRISLSPDANTLFNCRGAFEKNKIRRRFKLPVNTYLFYFAFDFNSSISRKNPIGVVKAFLSAFPQKLYRNGEVGLVLKVNNARSSDSLWKKIEDAAFIDNRIHILSDVLNKKDAIDFFSSCDCLVSLHSAEGFGRVIAEALLLKLDVICTDYGGNTDFCRSPLFKSQVKLVSYEMMPLRSGEYIQWEDQVWAKPNLKTASKFMKDCYCKKNKRKFPAPKRVNNITKYFSHAKSGSLYINRLNKVLKHLSGL